MCDTQVLIGADAVWFAKNSDREPSEPQPVIRVAAARGDTAATVRTTYLEIPQAPDRHAVILSKPVWCWGAEMGVNDRGVAIGNEAIFSREASTVPALLGMDLVRLGLERGASARAALDVMTALLERHGQGGPAGYVDKGFCYDNSFLIADAAGAWLLETAGREWAARRVTQCEAISNQLTLQGDHELRSPGTAAGENFARGHDTRLKPFFAGAHERRALSLANLAAAAAPSFARMATHLRAHHAGNEDPRDGSNRDVCMHAAGFVRRSQTTGSMIARLTAQGPTLLFTGTSAPCLSIFRPAGFEGEFSVLTPAEREVEALLWRRHEFLHRRALADRDLRGRLRATRESIEPKIYEQLEAAHPDAAALTRADRLAAAWHKVLWESLNARPVIRGTRFWERLSRIDGIAG
jgi:secernin